MRRLAVLAGVALTAGLVNVVPASAHFPQCPDQKQNTVPLSSGWNTVKVDTPLPSQAKPGKTMTLWVDDRDYASEDDLARRAALAFLENGVAGVDAELDHEHASGGLWIYEESYLANGLQRGGDATLFKTGVGTVDDTVAEVFIFDDPCDKSVANKDLVRF